MIFVYRLRPCDVDTLQAVGDATLHNSCTHVHQETAAIKLLQILCVRESTLPDVGTQANCSTPHTTLHAVLSTHYNAGFSARQRKQELERLNEQLRKINLNLRQQARAGTVYAPGLTYAPTPIPEVSIEGDGDAGLLGSPATWVPAARPEAAEDPQVGF